MNYRVTNSSLPGQWIAVTAAMLLLFLPCTTLNAAPPGQAGITPSTAPRGERVLDHFKVEIWDWDGGGGGALRVVSRGPDGERTIAGNFTPDATPRAFDWVLKVPGQYTLAIEAINPDFGDAGDGPRGVTIHVRVVDVQTGNPLLDKEQPRFRDANTLNYQVEEPPPEQPKSKLRDDLEKRLAKLRNATRGRVMTAEETQLESQLAAALSRLDTEDADNQQKRADARADLAASQRQYATSNAERGTVSPVYLPAGTQIKDANSPPRARTVTVFGVSDATDETGPYSADVALRLGEPVVNISNSQGGQASDLFDALWAKNIDLPSYMATDPTVKSVARMLDNADGDIRFISHSKGVLDAQLGIWKYAQDLQRQVDEGSITKSTMQQRLGRISIEAYGGASVKGLGLPTGVKSTAIDNPADPIPRVFGENVETAKGLAKLSIALVDPASLQSSHGWTNYRTFLKSR